MFCTNCGKQLPADGTPCACGSGQREPVQVPVVPEWTQPEQPEEDWAGDTTLLTWDEVAPQQEQIYVPEEEPEQIYVPEEEMAAEEDWAGDTTLLTWDEVAPQPEPAYVPEEQPQEEWAGDTTLLTWDEVSPQAPAQTEPPVYPQQPVYAPPAYNPPSYAAPTYAVQGGETTAKTVLGQIAQSPLFLIAVIAVSVQLLMGLISSFFPLDPLGMLHSVLDLVVRFVPDVPFTSDELMAQLLEEMGSEVTMALKLIRGVMIGGGLLGQIFPALTVAGLWVTFTSAKKKSVPSAGGFTLLQVVQIFSLIGVIISVLGVLSLVFSVIVMAIMMAQEMSYYGDASLAQYFGTAESIATLIVTLVVVVLVIMIAGVVLNLVYNIKLLGAVVGAKKVVKTGKITKKISMFVVIWNFLLAAGLLGDVIGKFLLSGVMSGIATLCAAAAYVLFSLCILKYNKAVKPLLENKSAAPAVPQAPYGY